MPTVPGPLKMRCRQPRHDFFSFTKVGGSIRSLPQMGKVLVAGHSFFMPRSNIRDPAWVGSEPDLHSLLSNCICRRGSSGRSKTNHSPIPSIRVVPSSAGNDGKSRGVFS